MQQYLHSLAFSHYGLFMCGVAAGIFAVFLGFVALYLTDKFRREKHPWLRVEFGYWLALVLLFCIGSICGAVFIFTGVK